MRGITGAPRDTMPGVCFGPAIAVVAVTAVMGAVSSIMQGQAAAAQAGYAAQVARNNQIIANRNDADSLKRGQIEEDKLRQRNALLLGRQRAELSGQGFLVDEGSPLDIQMDSAGLGELDALTLRSGYEREAYSYRVQGMNQEAQAILYDSKASSAMLGGYLGAAGSIIGGAAKAFGGGFGGAGAGASGGFGGGQGA